MLNPLTIIKQCLSYDTRLLNKYIKIWEKFSGLINIKFASEPVYGDNDKNKKTKVKSNEDELNTNFQGNKTPKENASYKFLLLIMLDSVIRANKRYYP